jgi:protein phosphatase
MGSRAVVIVCKDEAAATKRFGVIDEGIGICYTRTGRRFFNDRKLESEFLTRVQAAISAAGIWSEFSTDWVCLDCELMPWSAKAQELLRLQYAPAGAAARAALPDAIAALETAATRNSDISPLVERYRQRLEMAEKYIAAYRQYCWSVSSLDDLRLAPFHLLATEGAVHTKKDHIWHMETIARICGHDPKFLLATPHLLVDLVDNESQSRASTWWEEMTAAGGEGMVVKPLEFIATGVRGIVQPALKCRGREYLRIIYGPEYTAPENLNRLRARGLGAKRSLALRELALGIEGLERFVRLEPLRRAHECVFGVLALESEPVDPRL